MRGSSSRVILSLSVAVAIAACVLRSATCRPSSPHMQEIIVSILRQDRVFKNLLYEKVKVSAAEMPPSVKYVVRNAHNVDPLVVLNKLMKIGGGDTYSGDAVALATAIVGNAARCLFLKRVVVHLLLVLRMAELETNMKERVTRALVIAHIIPLLLDVLSSFGKKYTELLKVYDAIGVVESEQTEWTVKEGHEERLAEQLQALNNAVADSCAVSSASEYYAAMGLKSADPRGQPTVITAEQKVAADLALPVVVDLLKENENALLDLYDDMSLLKNVGQGAWKSILKSPDLTPNAKDFKRQTQTGYYENVTSVLEKSWMELPANDAAGSSSSSIVIECH